MKPINPLSIDFYTLNILLLVYELQSFSAASLKLKCNQSSISYAIGRLRKVFNDPLFMRQGNHITPTLRCHELIKELSPIVAKYQQLTIVDKFDPSCAVGDVTFACSFYEQSIFLIQFIKELRLLAPDLTIKLIHSGTQGLSKLKQADCDFLFSPMSLDASDLHKKTLWDDYYICAMDYKNPLSNNTLSLADLNNADHVLITYDGYWQPFYQEKLLALGVNLNASIELASLSSLEMTLRDTQLVSLTSAKFANGFGEGMKVMQAPVSVDFNNYLYWTTRTHNDPMHRWLRKLITQLSVKKFIT
ncbi:MAG: DNA-binding transcriptional LysR family regulator [Oceanospirillaceae bacterium]|jgi:DNA-binding transcriptional LysR family regulator